MIFELTSRMVLGLEIGFAYIWMCTCPADDLLCEFLVILIDEIGAFLSILWDLGYVRRGSVKRWDAYEQKLARSVFV